MKALDANSGKVLWTAYSTGPDSEVLIGPRFKPFYATFAKEPCQGVQVHIDPKRAETIVEMVAA